MAAGFGWLWVGSGIVSRRCWWRGRRCHARRATSSTTGCRSSLLPPAGFDAFVAGLCAPYYAARRGRPSLPPGRYFRMLLAGDFEGIDSEGGLGGRCAASISPRAFRGLGDGGPVRDHAWLGRPRARLPLEVHDAVFTWVLRRLAERGLVRGERADRRRRLDHGGQRGAAGD